MRTFPCRWRDRVAGPAFRRVRSYGRLTGDRSSAPVADLGRLSTLRSALQTSHLDPPTRLTIMMAFGLASEVMAHYAGRARSCQWPAVTLLGVPVTYPIGQ
jgi:hypothetical protein